MNPKFTFEEKFTEPLNEFMKELDKCLFGAWKAIDYNMNEARSQWRHVQMVKGEPYVLHILFYDFNTRPTHRTKLVIQYEEKDNKIIINDIHSILMSDGIGIMTKDFENAYSKEVLIYIGHEIKSIPRKELVENRIAERVKDLRMKQMSLDELKATIRKLRVTRLNLSNEIDDIETEIEELKEELHG